jgi:DNA polymerase V
MTIELPSRNASRRSGAGRPAGTGKYAEPTRTIRVPESAVPVLVRYLDDLRLARLAASVPSERVALDPPELRIPVVLVRVPAGSPMPAEQSFDESCDLNRLMIRNPAKTRIFTVEGDSMNRTGIEEGDRLIVDCGLEARDGDIVIAIVLGDGHTLKRLRTRGPRPQLVPESTNPVHKIRELREHDEWLIWGVVTGALKQFR